MRVRESEFVHHGGDFFLGNEDKGPYECQVASEHDLFRRHGDEFTVEKEVHECRFRKIVTVVAEGYPVKPLLRCVLKNSFSPVP